MSLSSFGWFIKLLNEGHQVQAMGFHGTPGDVQRLSARLRAAKAFRGILLEGVTSATVRGYNAFFQILLTHSALEQYHRLTDQEKKPDEVEAVHRVFGSESAIKRFFALDPKGSLFTFLCKHSTNKTLKRQLSECRDGRCHNVGVISAVIRHMFAHGHLAATSNDVAPGRAYRACMLVSDFLLDYIDADFAQRLDKYWRGYKAKEGRRRGDLLTPLRERRSAAPSAAGNDRPTERHRG